jgi:DNA-binding response OmpR family regulator
MPKYAAQCRRGNRTDGVKYDVAMRLLLVEDDPGVLRFVLKGLREQAYAVDTAITGDDALYQAEINTYDLIILDVMIPGCDGFAVCKQIRSTGNRVPILMLTALDGVEDRIAGLDVGADDYLTKPFAFRELLARLRALLRRSGELRPPDIIVADLVVETAGQTVTRGGRRIALTTKEYALVEFLARNAGRVMGRAAIAQHVWEESFDPFSNLIEVYVNRLRRKIDADSKVPLLHTRRGAGYLFGPAEENPRANDSAERDEQRPAKKKLNPASKKNHA